MEKFVKVQAPSPFRVVNAGGYTYHFDKDGFAMLHEEALSSLSSEYTVLREEKPKTSTKVSSDSTITKIVKEIRGKKAE